MNKLLPMLISVALSIFGVIPVTVAQDWPQQNIRIVVSFGPGGGADIIGRILADSMQAKLGKPVIIENRPGAGGILGNDVVAKAAPDGYTLGIMTAGQIIASVTKKNMPYDTLTAFAPVTQVATASLLIVSRPNFPANNVKELVVMAKANPGKIAYASSGPGSTNHLCAAMLEKMGCVVDVVEDGDAACSAVAHKRYDLVFMDCHMPLMDGFEATRCIRDRAQGDATRTPIVALTADALAGDRERCLAAGMDDYMTKPVSTAQLAAAVQRWAGSAPAPG